MKKGSENFGEVFTNYKLVRIGGWNYKSHPGPINNLTTPRRGNWKFLLIVKRRCNLRLVKDSTPSGVASLRGEIRVVAISSHKAEEVLD
ncbi:hypothetical protein [uncultured Algoriphagus sp.]|uniref:hypothetical protein n=1 Tax=uncultured Algoriphagus sp. TaxID=417365 RepID=UPI0030EF5D73